MKTLTELLNKKLEAAFEKCGYSEVKVAAGFVITTILLCFFGILAL